jgi:hypothetical protein
MQQVKHSHIALFAIWRSIGGFWISLFNCFYVHSSSGCAVFCDALAQICNVGKCVTDWFGAHLLGQWKRQSVGFPFFYCNLPQELFILRELYKVSLILETTVSNQRFLTWCDLDFYGTHSWRMQGPLKSWWWASSQAVLIRCSWMCTLI